eukprot:Skav204298  [mRNA]  locus=scaffold2227:52259:62186:- [translate_table: standard]
MVQPAQRGQAAALQVISEYYEQIHTKRLCELVGLELRAPGLTSFQAIFTGAGRDFAGAELGKLSAGQKLMVLGGAAATGAIAAWLMSRAMALAGKEFDLIFDCVGTPEDWPKASKVLKKGGNTSCKRGPGTFVTIANFGEAKSTEDHSFKCLGRVAAWWPSW